MRRHAFSAVIAIGLFVVGIITVVRGQAAVGILFMAIALLRGGSILWGSRRNRAAEPEIRLRLDDEASGRDETKRS